jgi:protein-tyrosine-phosphatase
MKDMGSSRFEAFSAGVTPKGQVSPITLRLLQTKFRIDPSGARSKSWEEFKDEHLDFVVSVPEQAEETSHAFRVSRSSLIGPTMIPAKSTEHPKKWRQPIFASLHEFAIVCSCSITFPSTRLIGFALK